MTRIRKIRSITTIVLICAALGCDQFGLNTTPQKEAQPSLAFDQANRLAIEFIQKNNIDPLTHDLYIIAPDATKYQVTVTVKSKPFEEVLRFYIDDKGNILSE